MRLADGLGPDMLIPDFEDLRSDEDAGFEVVADGDHHSADLLDAELAQHGLIRRIGSGDEGQFVGVLGHDRLVDVDADDIDAVGGQLCGQ